MKRTFLAVCLSSLVVATFGMGCMDRAPAPVCPVPTELSQSEALVTNFQGLDMLLVVDNSGSMAEEQEIFATAIYRLVNTLTNNPDPNWAWPDVANVRIGVVSSDMGLQYGPDGKIPPDDVSLARCGGKGDDGEFIPDQIQQYLTLAEGEIQCIVDTDAGPAASDHCPFFGDTDNAWNCEDQGSDGTFHCYVDATGTDTDNPATNIIDCNEVISAVAAPWAFTPNNPGDTDNPPDLNFGLPLEVACLTNLGTDGCGIEQQLQSSKKALDNYTETFIRETSLLAVLIVSDEEDCSIESADLFSTPEFSNDSLRSVNIACDIYADDYLFAAESYAKAFAEAKGGASAAVVFAAIVGVPINDTCEGFGNEIGACNDDDDMEFVVIEDPTSAQKVARPACERYDNSDPPKKVTEARPGRRYVDLAVEMGGKGYISSICRPDWSKATENIAKLIASNLSSSCYPKPLDWDPDEEVAKCDVVIIKEIDQKANSIDDWDEVCEFPLNLEEGDAPIYEEEVSGSEDSETYTTTVYCPLPKIPAKLDCNDNDFAEINSQFGWYYCEDPNEDFADACIDALDNDNDGLYDCEDDDCTNCPACGGKECDNPDSCQYAVRLTKNAQDNKAVKNQYMAVQCLQRFQFTDENCQENTENVCNDHKDNDGNGVLDCDGAKSDEEDGDWHFADPSCCPIPATNIDIEKDEDGKETKRTCILTNEDGSLVFENTCGTYSADNPPPACRTRAAELSCQLPLTISQ